MTSTATLYPTTDLEKTAYFTTLAVRAIDDFHRGRFTTMIDSLISAQLDTFQPCAYSDLERCLVASFEAELDK